VLYHKMQPYVHIDYGRVAVDWQRSKEAVNYHQGDSGLRWHVAWMTVTTLPTVMSSVPRIDD